VHHADADADADADAEANDPSGEAASGQRTADTPGDGQDVSTAERRTDGVAPTQ
jgi:hypothetical protein